MSDNASSSLLKAASEPNLTALDPGPVSDSSDDDNPVPHSPPSLHLPIPDLANSPSSPSPRSSLRSPKRSSTRSPPPLSPQSSPSLSPTPLNHNSPFPSQQPNEAFSFSAYVASELAGDQSLGVSFVPASSPAGPFVPATDIAIDPSGVHLPLSLEEERASEEGDSRKPSRPSKLPFEHLPAFSDQQEQLSQSGSISMSRFGKLACIQLDAHGDVTSREMTRGEILHEARETLNKGQPSPRAVGEWLSNAGMAQSPSPEFKKFTSMLEGAGVHTRKATQKALRDYLRNSLQARDIRQVDPAFAAKPALWVRHSALVVSLDGSRAIILHNKMFLFDPENGKTKELVFLVRQNILAKPDAENVQPFEFKALEGILIFLAMRFEKDFSELQPTIENLLSELPSELTTKMLEDLRRQKQLLNQFQARLNNVKAILDNLLDEDEEMASMYLTEKHMSHNLYSRSAVDHSEVETMLEAYLQVIDEYVNHASLLNEAIDDTEDLVMIHLDTLRNRLLSVELALSVVSMTFGIGGVIAGLFGMNIQMPLFETESSRLWFLFIVVGILVMVVATSLVVLVALRRRGLLDAATTWLALAAVNRYSITQTEQFLSESL